MHCINVKHFTSISISFQSDDRRKMLYEYHAHAAREDTWTFGRLKQQIRDATRSVAAKLLVATTLTSPNFHHNTD